MALFRTAREIQRYPELSSNAQDDSGRIPYLDVSLLIENKSFKHLGLAKTIYYLSCRSMLRRKVVLEMNDF